LASLKRISAIGATASLSPIVEFGLRFLRTVVLSRFLVPQEFGIAVGIGAVLATVELAGDISLDKFVVVRARDEAAAALAAAHALSIGRGLLLALVVFVAGGPVAEFMDAPAAAGSFQLAGLVILVRSFAHLQIKQMQAEYKYLPELIASLAAHGSAVAVVLPLLRIVGDHRVIVGSFLTEALVYLVASHLLARVPFALRGDRAVMAAALRFGLPLTLNGIGLAAAAHLDRMIVGHWLGVVALAHYALILTIGVAPVGVLLTITLKLALPYMADRQRGAAAQREAEITIVWLYAILAGAYALWVAGSLDVLVPLVFGPAYRVDPDVRALVTVLVSVRIIQHAPTIFLLANGKTGRLALTRLSSIGGLVVALALVMSAARLEAVLTGVLVGDLLGLALLFRLSRPDDPRHRLALWRPAIGSLGVTLVAVGVIWLWSGDAWASRGFLLALAFPIWLVQAGIGYRRWREPAAARA
jgi:O-antigen/teichoic acid export membrane protein